MPTSQNNCSPAVSTELLPVASHYSAAQQHRTHGNTLGTIDLLRQAIAANPSEPIYHDSLGSALQELGHLDEAIASYRRALSIAPAFAQAQCNLGTALHLQSRFAEAVACYQTALTINPKNALAYCNLGVSLKALGYLTEAVQCYQRALTIEPDNADTYNNLANAHREQGRLNDAITCSRKALTLKPEFATAHWNLSLNLLFNGDYAEGLFEFEHRFNGGNQRVFAASRAMLQWLGNKPRWQGDNLHRRTLLVWTEQGQGDSLMMMRYLPLLAAKGARRVIVYCEPSLRRLIAQLPGVDQAIDKITRADLEHIDCHCPMMSLPHLFGTVMTTIPAAVPYIHPPVDMTTRWGQRFGGERQLRVGLVWAGGSATITDARRSMAFSELKPLMNAPQVTYVSLQKGKPAQQINGAGWSVEDWMDVCHDFLDTAALIHNLDLVISVDTAVAHLAGAMGKPVWLLNRHDSEWRWQLGREDAPWYPTLRQYRQSRPGEWRDVIQRVLSTLLHFN